MAVAGAARESSAASSHSSAAAAATPSPRPPAMPPVLLSGSASGAAAGASSAAAGSLPNLADPGVFEGLRRGLDTSSEEKEWKKYWQAWKKGKPDITKAMAVELGEKYGVSLEGTTAHILARVSRTAQEKRRQELNKVMRARGLEDDDDYEYTELKMYR